MGSVLVGVDGSTEAVGAVAVARWLTERLGLPLVVAHVVDDAPTFPHGDEQAQELRRRRGTAAGWELTRDASHTAGGDARSQLVYGEPLSSLATLANEGAAELVVVGSRGRGAFKAALLGSVSRGLTSRCDCPVMIVSPAAAKRQLSARPGAPGSSIVCGVNGSEEADAAVLAATALAERGGLRLVLVHTVAPPVSPAAVPTAGVGVPVDDHARLIQRQREAATRLVEVARRAVADRDVDVTGRVEVGDAASGLERLAVEEDAVLIAVGTHGRGVVRAALLGSTSATLGGLASRPVVLVPAGAAIPFEPRRAGGPVSPA